MGVVVDRGTPLAPGAGHGGHLTATQAYAAQQVVDRVGHHQVVSGDLGRVFREQAQPLWLGEGGDLGRTVDPTSAAGADRAQQGLPVRGQLDHPVPGRVRHQQVALRAHHQLAGEAQGGLRFRRGDVRAVAPVQGALGLVGGDQVVDQPGQPFGVALAGHRGHHVTLRIDHREGRPGAGRILLPHVQVRIIEYGMVHPVPLDGGGQGVRVLLVLELWRVHPDHDEDVRVLLLKRAQFVQYVQAVDAAEGPEVGNYDLASKVGEGQFPPTGVQPTPTPQLRRPYACTHDPIVPYRRPAWSAGRDLRVIGSVTAKLRYPSRRDTAIPAQRSRSSS